VQMVRPRMGFGADQGRRCTPWMVGGMGVLSLGGCLAAQAIVTMGSDRGLGVALAALAFAMIGVGVSACGTSLLVLLAKRVGDDRRAPAATLVWVMMIVGFALTAVLVGKQLDPYSPERLLRVVCTAAGLAWLIACVCLWGLEGPADPAPQRGGAPAAPTALAQPAAPLAGEPVSAAQGAASVRFRQALAQVWDEPAARRFTVFVFLSMLAYSSQDLILEPFAGAVFDMTPGQTTQLSGLQHGGVLLGMLCVALAGSGWARGRFGSVQAWMVGGCLASALAMAGLSLAAGLGGAWPLLANVFLLGVANGAFSIAAITTMMRLAAAAKGSAGPSWLAPRKDSKPPDQDHFVVAVPPVFLVGLGSRSSKDFVKRRRVLVAPAPRMTVPGFRTKSRRERLNSPAGMAMTPPFSNAFSNAAVSSCLSFGLAPKSTTEHVGAGDFGKSPPKS